MAARDSRVSTEVSSVGDKGGNVVAIECLNSYNSRKTGRQRTYRLFSKNITRVVIVDPANCQCPSYSDVSPAPRSLRGRSKGEMPLRPKGPNQGL